MSVLYLDTSALVKRYFPEMGSRWIGALTDPVNKHTLVLSALTQVETAAAFAIKQRSGAASVEERDAALKLLMLHVSDHRVRPCRRRSPLLDRAMELTQRHRLRGYDAVQLATAFVTNSAYLAAALPPLTFISADNDLNLVAEAEGLAADNPNKYL